MITKSLAPALGGVFLIRFQGLFHGLSDNQFHYATLQDSIQELTRSLYLIIPSIRLNLIFWNPIESVYSLLFFKPIIFFIEFF
jgi:hypothetical protein